MQTGTAMTKPNRIDSAETASVTAAPIRSNTRLAATEVVPRNSLMSRAVAPSGQPRLALRRRDVVDRKLHLRAEPLDLQLADFAVLIVFLDPGIDRRQQRVVALAQHPGEIGGR